VVELVGLVGLLWVRRVSMGWQWLVWLTQAEGGSEEVSDGAEKREGEQHTRGDLEK
jgi:hypothetical protein